MPEKFKKANAGWILAGFLFLFLALRFLTLLTAVEWVFDWEELYRGTIAKEILSGLKMPLWDYQADVYSGGSLVTGFLAAFLFKISGPSLFALKCVPLFFAAASLAVTFLFMKRFFGMRAACFAALFFIFCAPGFAQFSLIAMGYHSESVFFTALILFLFYRLWYGAPSSWNLPLCGFVCGLSFWFTNITGITILTVLVSWFLLDRAGFFRGFFRFCFFFALGMLPWLAYNLTHQWKGLEFILSAFVRLYQNDDFAPTLELSPMKLARLIFRGIPLSWCFADLGPLRGWISCYLYSALGLFSLVFFILRRVLRPPQNPGSVSKLPFFLYPVFFLLIYWASRVGIIYVTPEEPFYRFFEFRYFVPLQFFLFCLLAFAAASSRFCQYAAIGLWGLGLLGQFPLFFQESFGRALRYRGYSHAAMGMTLEQSEVFPGSLRSFLKVIENRPDAAEKQKIAKGFFSWGVVLSREFQKSEKLAETLKTFPQEYMPELMQGLGLFFAYETPVAYPLIEEILKGRSEKERNYFYYGFSSGRPEEVYSGPYRKWFLMHAGQRRFLPSESLQSLVEFPAGGQKWFYRGVGGGAVIHWIFRKGSFEKIAARSQVKVPEEAIRDFYWGAGWEIARELGEDEIRAGDWLKRLPAHAHLPARQGFEAGLQRFWRISSEKGAL